MFLQSSFLTVVDFNKSIFKDKTRICITDELLNERMQIASRWINDTQSMLMFTDSKLEEGNAAKITNSGYADLHQIISWED